MLTKTSFSPIIPSGSSQNDQTKTVHDHCKNAAKPYNEHTEKKRRFLKKNPLQIKMNITRIQQKS